MAATSERADETVKTEMRERERAREREREREREAHKKYLRAFNPQKHIHTHTHKLSSKNSQKILGGRDDACSVALDVISREGQDVPGVGKRAVECASGNRGQIVAGQRAMCVCVCMWGACV